ncbi:MAG: tetratricopeptide repeat protein [Magnetococcales bacterium]|nr:tetratricopeptide repeat protein [Magnetococcales bacterium]
MKPSKPKTRTASIPQPNAASASMIEQALQMHQTGQLEQAEILYHKLLQENPRHQDALNLLGFLNYERGLKDQAIDWIKKAIDVDPQQPLFYNNLGIVLQNHHKQDEALQCYHKALAINPSYHAAYSNMGTLLQSMGKLDEAMSCQEKAMALNPNFFEAYTNKGNILCDQGKLEEAIEWYKKALTINPQYITAMHNMGYVLQKMNKLDEAKLQLEKALEIKPNYLEALNCLGNVFQDQGQWKNAIACYQKALSFNPNYYEAYCNMGNVLCDQGNLEEAIACHQKALTIKPDLHESFTHMGNALQLQGRMDEAIACYKQALVISPRDKTAMENLGVACNVHGDLQGAIECNRKLLTIQENNPNVIASLLNLLKQTCDWSEIDSLFDQMMTLFNSGEKMINPFVFLTLATTPKQQKICAEYYIEKKYRARRHLCDQRSYDKSASRIKIGYLSCDFLNHATAILIAELIKLHDRSRFEILIYSYSDNDGKEMRQRIIESSDQFIDILHVNHENAAQKILEDGVHILVELKGFTKGARLEISALRPAPIQVSWLGYPGTMGATYIDYIFADPFIIPHGHESDYTEKVVRLPDCYQPNDRLRIYPEQTGSRQEHGLPEHGLIFSNFNQTYKITPEIFAIWMDLLRQIPESCLWLLESNDLVAANLCREAEAHGVNPSRLVFAPKLPVPIHLARYHLVDLVLDTYPVTSHTTASDALWVGAPLLSYVGDTFVSRVAGSLLHAIGLPELVTHSLEEYAALALELARDPQRLQALRYRLQANRLTSPLFDTPRFTKGLEAAYEAIWQRYCEGVAPDHLDITLSPTSPKPLSSTPTVVPNTPIMLSICIPTFNRHEQLACALNHLKWTLNCDIAIEIIVSDNASDDDTPRIAQEMGRLFPRFRYVRQAHTVEEANHSLATMRLAHGQYFICLADHDRLVPEVVLAEIAYLNQHDDIVANHAPWRLWNDLTNTDMGTFYHLDEPITFSKAQSAEMFNTILSRHIFPEIAIYRTASYTKVLFDCSYVCTPFVMEFRALHYGKIRFQPTPFYISVVQSPIQTRNTPKDATRLLSRLDHYRAGLEIAASLALSNIGMTEFNEGNRIVVLDLINDFLIKRTLVAATVALAQGNPIAASLFLKRALLWCKSDTEKNFIREMESEVVTGATYQAIKELFEMTVDVQRIVLCNVSNPEVISASFRIIAPEISVVVRNLQTALNEPDWQACLYLTEQESVRHSLHEAGLEIGKVLLTTDLLYLFRVTS